MTTQISLWDGTALPALGLGCWAIGGPFWAGEQALGWGEVDDQESIRAVRRGIDLGIRLFDTADVYGAGHAEEVLSAALQGVKEDVRVATKLGNAFDAETKQRTGSGTSADYVRGAVDGSLRRLGMERLDLVLFHINHHPVEESRELFATLAALRDAGKVGAFGWSTDNAEDAAAFADMPGFVAVEHDMNLFNPATDIVTMLAEHDLVGLARQPLAMGLLTGKFRPGGAGFAASDIRRDGPEWLRYFRDGAPAPDLLNKVEAVRELLTVGGRTVTQGALTWIWAKSPRVVPIPGFRTVKQVEENAGALAFGPLPADTVAEIDKVMAG